MRRRGYSSYHGRTTVGDILKVIIVVLAVVLVLLVAGLIWGQRYIVYTDNGIRLDLPFFRQEDGGSSGPGSGSISISIEHQPGGSSSVVDPDPGPVPDPEPEVYAMRAVWMTLEQLQSGGAAAVTAQGANTVVLDMKQEDGMLNYVSGLEEAQKVSAREDQVTALIQAMHQADIRVVAAVSCFRDDVMGNKSQYALLTNSGYHWRYDDENLYWANPTREAARAYVAGVVGELAGLGFDEILLYNCGFPTQGQIGWIRKNASNYDPDGLSAAVDSFLALAQQAVAHTDTVLSVAATAQVLDGTDTRSGLTAAALASMSGRVWLEQDGQTDLAALAAQAGITDPERVVYAAGAFAGEQTHQSIFR